jgi:virulence-associated protein VagC
VTDVVETKTFRNGGSLAVRIPAGWVSDGELTLSRDSKTGDIRISQRTAKLSQLLAELAESDSFEDPIFDQGIQRVNSLDERSVFERQDDDVATNRH